MTRAAFFALLSAATFASAASADVVIKIKETESKKVSTGAWVFGPDHLSMRWNDPDESHGGVLFDAGKDVLYVIDDKKKSYKQIDKAVIDQTAGQVNAAREQMKAQIAQLPADQRAKAEEMMKKYENRSSENKSEYRKTSETRVINGSTCTKYDRYSGDQLESHLWVAPYSALKLTESDGAVFQKLGEFSERLTGAFGVKRHDYIPMHELNGVPLLTEEVENGKVTRTTIVESVTHEPAPPGVYAVPAGYKLEPMDK
jgi:hypothetical protein